MLESFTHSGLHVELFMLSKSVCASVCSTHTKRRGNTKETYFELNERFVWSAWGVNPFQRAEHADSG